VATEEPGKGADSEGGLPVKRKTKL